MEKTNRGEVAEIALGLSGIVVLWSLGYCVLASIARSLGVGTELFRGFPNFHPSKLGLVMDLGYVAFGGAASIGYVRATRKKFAAGARKNGAMLGLRVGIVVLTA